jgi:hypothetical protein
MSDLKFTCPSCGQHVQLDASYAGEKIPCPSCAAVVRVPVDAPTVTPTPITDDAPAAPAPGGSLAVPTLEDNFGHENGTPAVPSTPPMTEREQQLAAARAAHPVLAMPTVKPRLSYILSGGQAPVPQENESATRPEEKHREHTEEPHHKSLSE